MNSLEYVRLSKVVQHLGVSRKVVYYWARHGLLGGAVCLNGIWLVKTDEFKAWLAEHHQSQTQKQSPAPRPTIAVKGLELERASLADKRLNARLAKLQTKTLQKPD